MDGSFFAEEGRRVKHPAAADRSVPVVGRSRHRRGHHRHYVQNPVVDVTQKRLISARLLNTWTGVRKEIVCDNRDTRAESRRGFGTPAGFAGDRKSTRLNSSHVAISYAVFCLTKNTS